MQPTVLVPVPTGAKRRRISYQMIHNFFPCTVLVPVTTPTSKDESSLPSHLFQIYYHILPNCVQFFFHRNKRNKTSKKRIQLNKTCKILRDVQNDHSAEKHESYVRTYVRINEKRILIEYVI